MRKISQIVCVLSLCSFSTLVIGQEKTEVKDTSKVEETIDKTKKKATSKGDEKKAETTKKEDKKVEAKVEAKEGEVVGPGGKPLRLDYPGTEESKSSLMKTSEIEGIETNHKSPSTAYGLRVRELETKIDDLKERVFQSKTRIVLLREKLLSGNLAGSKAIIVHKTELGSAWRLAQAIYHLDGTRVFSQIDENGSLSDKKSFEVYNGGLAPGYHKITIFLKYQGTSVGIFPYFKGYSGEIRMVCDIEAKEGKLGNTEVFIYPKGGITESIEKRPNIRCENTHYDNVVETNGKKKAQPNKQPSPQTPVQ